MAFFAYKPNVQDVPSQLNALNLNVKVEITVAPILLGVAKGMAKHVRKEVDSLTDGL